MIMLAFTVDATPARKNVKRQSRVSSSTFMLFHYMITKDTYSLTAPFVVPQQFALNIWSYINDNHIVV